MYPAEGIGVNHVGEKKMSIIVSSLKRKRRIVVSLAYASGSEKRLAVAQVDDAQVDRLEAFLVHRLGGNRGAGAGVNPGVRELLHFDAARLVDAALLHAAIDVKLDRVDGAQVCV